MLTPGGLLSRDHCCWAHWAVVCSVVLAYLRHKIEMRNSSRLGECINVLTKFGRENDSVED